MSKPDITLRQLRYLIAVDEELHFRRAAERCRISQPSLSAQIQALEAALDVHLVERSRSGVALTPVGREVAMRARRTLENVQSIVDFCCGAQDGLTGTIRLGAKPTLGPYLLPQVVAKLHRQHQDLNLYVREAAPRELEYELIRGVHDVILAQLPVASSELTTERLFREPLYVALAADHPLTEFETIDPKSLRDEAVLTLSPNYHLHDQIMDLCADFGATPRRDYEGTSLDAVRQMVGMGMGVSFLPALYVQSELTSRSEVVVRPLKGRMVTRSIGLAWRNSAGRSNSYSEFARIIRDVAARKFKNLIVESA